MDWKEKRYIKRGRYWHQELTRLMWKRPINEERINAQRQREPRSRRCQLVMRNERSVKISTSIAWFLERTYVHRVYAYVRNFQFSNLIWLCLAKTTRAYLLYLVRAISMTVSGFWRYATRVIRAHIWLWEKYSIVLYKSQLRLIS